MRISIVMATYNGEQFIKEQLESIRLQSRQADEVLIFDDCSTDKTALIIEEYIQENQLNKWKIKINEKNKGWKRNFIEGFSQASGDLIFCADQDDIWLEDKIQNMAEEFEQNSTIEVLACNLIPKYEDDAAPIAQFYVRPYGKNKIEQVNFDKFGFEVLRPGCTMCFKSNIASYISKIWRDPLAHDELLWIIGILRGSAYILNIPLINFRRHGKNNSPINKKTSSIRSEVILRNIDKASLMIENADLLEISNVKLESLKKMRDFYGVRYEALSNRKFFKVIRLGTCLNMYVSPKAWIADIISIFR